MDAVRTDRRLAAILATDIVGYSRLIGADEGGTLAAIRRIRAEVIEPVLVENRGRIAKLMGDGAIIEFGSVVDALSFAVAMQIDCAAHQADVPAERKIVHRVGINLGDVVVDGEDLLGDGVNIAARLEQICDPGGVLLSGAAYDQVHGKTVFHFDYVGEQPVKNIDRPVRAYRVRMDGSRPSLSLRVRPYRRYAKALVATLALLVVGGGLLWNFRDNSPSIVRAAVAVLPFDNLGGDEATGRLANGITEDIITDLARFRDFDVIARNSTEIYAGKPVDVRQVGKDLGVRYVLEGSVQRQGEEIRVTAQLIDAREGAHIWSDRWDRPADDVFAVQTEIVEQAVNRLGGAGIIMEAENREAQRRRPEDLGAYELYLLGRDRLLSPSKERIDEAIDLFKRAVAADPTLARAWVDLAWAYDISTGYGADYASAHALALEAARRAVELDPMDAGAHTVFGSMVGADGDLAVAKREFETALRLNPGSADILMQYAGWASGFGDPAAGGEAADRAIRMNPNYPVGMGSWLSYGYLMAERFEDSLHVAEREPEADRNKYSWVKIAISLAQLGRADEAKSAVGKALARFPDLTVESFVNEPGSTDEERRKFIEWMQAAGFPPCAKPGQLDQVSKPVRISECEAQSSG